MSDAFEDDLIAQLNVVVENGLRGAKVAIKKGLRFLATISPVDTGWYERNHRISINGSEVDVDPAERPSRGKDAEKVNISPAELVARESATLDLAQLGDEISIVNAVPYADAIENLGTATTPEGHYYALTEQYIAGLVEGDPGILVGEDID